MAENDSKKYYWIKLKQKFFDDYKFKLLENMPNGRIYELIYLKLLTESTSHNGRLRFSEAIPYDPYTLSIVISEDKDNVENAIKVLQNLELVEILDDGTYFMTELNKIVGSETGQTIRKREAKLSGKSVVKITQENRVKSIENRDKSIEYIDILSKDNISMSTKVDDVLNLYESICLSYPKIRRPISEKRKKCINARLKKYTMDDLRELFTIAENCDFLKGQNKRNWVATFDWLLADGNLSKVLEHKYDNYKKNDIVNNQINNNEINLETIQNMQNK